MPETLDQWLYLLTFALWLVASLVLMCIKKHRQLGKTLFWIWLIVVGGMTLLTISVVGGIMHYCSSVGGC